MSKKQTPNATLDGYNGPMYTKGLEKLNDLMDYLDSGPKLDALFNRVEELHPTTADGYHWYRMITHKTTDKRVILVAFPWRQDLAKKDDSLMDRSCAVYTQGEVTAEEIDEFIKYVIYTIINR